MKPNLYRWSLILIVFVFLLDACGSSSASQPTPDAAAIATGAAQTVEARFTQQALVDLATQAATATPVQAGETATPQAASGSPSYEYKPGCVYATFVADITIPDGMLFAPGETFTKTWRIKNSGSCKWDTSFALVFFSGDKMSEQNSFPLTRVIYPGQEVDLSATLTAPTAEGNYQSEWRLGLPVGTAGVGQADDNLTVSIEVTSKPDRAFDVTSVTYSMERDPIKGCTADGAVYTFYATITVNGPGELSYQWDRMPYDGGKLEGGKLKFTEAGSATVSWKWTMTSDHVQNIDRWVALETLGSHEHVYERVRFNYTCK